MTRVSINLNPSNLGANLSDESSPFSDLPSGICTIIINWIKLSTKTTDYPKIIKTWSANSALNWKLELKQTNPYLMVRILDAEGEIDRGAEGRCDSHRRSDDSWFLHRLDSVSCSSEYGIRKERGKVEKFEKDERERRWALIYQRLLEVETWNEPAGPIYTANPSNGWKII